MVEAQARVLEAGWPIVELPVPYRLRWGGHSRFPAGCGVWSRPESRSCPPWTVVVRAGVTSRVGPRRCLGVDVSSRLLPVWMALLLTGA